MNIDFHYLATPYTNYLHGRQAAYIMACRLAARLIRAGIAVYTPIGHAHPIAIAGDLDPVDHELWMRVDAPFVHHACGLIVGMMPGWQESHGVKYEIDRFVECGKPVIYWDIEVPLPVLPA